MTGIPFAALTAAQERTTELMATGASRAEREAAVQYEMDMADAYFAANPDAAAQVQAAAELDAAQYEAGHPAPDGWLTIDLVTAAESRANPAPEPAAEYEAEAG
jgi:hypothetical protein